MKRILVGVALAFSLAMVVRIASAGDDEFAERTGLKYRWNGGDPTEFDKPEAACRAGVEYLKKQGNKQEYVSIKDGPGDGRMTCVLKNLNGTVKEVWDQTNLVEKLVQCPATTKVQSFDGSGTFTSQKCKCDPDKGCPVAPAAPAAGSGSAAAPDHCKRYAFTIACTTAKSPPGVDRSARCTQQPASHTTKQQAAERSAENVKATRRKRGLVAKYDAAKDEIGAAELAKKRKKFGSRVKSGFPEYGPSDMCPGVNDVNIGTLCGADESDFAAANNIAGYGAKPEGCTWHHHEDLGRLLLVKSEGMHGAVGHTGGRAIWKQANKLKEYPRCCP
jgi:hypothetical protein